MAELWKAWKAKGRLSPPPPTPWKSRTRREIPTFPQPRRSGMEKWKTKSRFSTFPFHFATTTPVPCLPNPTASGRQSRRFAAHRTPSRGPDRNFAPNRKELLPGLQRLKFSGSSCIGNKSRSQDHLSIGICSDRRPFNATPRRREERRLGPSFSVFALRLGVSAVSAEWG